MTEKQSHKGEGHRKRLMEKFLDSGLSGFHDYEVVELLLTLCTPRRDCKGPAREALKKFGTLQGVFQASDADLMAIKGVGKKNVFGLKLIKETADRYLEKRLIKRDVISNSTALEDYLTYNMRDHRVERFKVVFLDAKNRVLGLRTLFTGTLSSSAVYPREVINAALDYNAASLIFAHNHPSGDATPSPDDFAITRKLIMACRTMGLTVHEHMIIGDNSRFSFADNGYIAEYNREYEKGHG